MTIAVIVDHTADAIDRFLSQFKNKPNMANLVTMLTEQIQDLEDDLAPLAALRMLDQATGIQLDKFGDIVGQLRGGREDEFYRVVLAGKIGVNNSEGTGEELISTFKTYSQISDFQVIPYYPAAVQIVTDQIPVFPDEFLIQDADMEALNTDAWIPVNNATLTKSIVTPQEGLQSLRVAYNGTNDPAALQNILTFDHWYWLRGYVRMGSLGANIPQIWNGSGTLWTGVNSTDWYEFNVIFQAVSGTLSWGADLTGAGYVEYDNMEIRRVKKDYAPEIFNICQSVVGAGIELIRIVYYDSDDAFAFQGGPLGKGYGTISDPTVGGKYASLF